MTVRTVNRVALALVAPAVAVGLVLTVTILLAFVGVPVLAVSLPALVLAVMGGVGGARRPTIHRGLPWALGAFALALVLAVGTAATFARDDVDQPEEVVLLVALLAWAAAGAAVALRARSAEPQGAEAALSRR